MVTGILLLFFYSLALTGIFLASGRVVERIALFRETTFFNRCVLGTALFPALVSLTAYSGVFRIHYVLTILVCAAAAYGARQLFLHRFYLKQKLGNVLLRQYWPLLALLGVLALTFAITQWCYLFGGNNNWQYDYIRAASLTTSLAANYLKPAFALDLSIPVSYGYYAYVFSAFLYGGVDGYSWPSLPILLVAIVSISFFYYGYTQFCRLFMPVIPGYTLALLAIATISFYGLDIFINENATYNHHIEWWQKMQITQMASQWHFIPHYLLAAGLGMLGICEVQKGAVRANASALITGLLFIFLTLFYATLTGVFLGAVTLLTLLAYAVFGMPKARVSMLCRHMLRNAHWLLLIVLLATLPQLFTFVGRQGYLQWQGVHLWMAEVKLVNATPADFKLLLLRLFYELGPLMLMGLTVVPFMIWKISNENRFAALLAASMLVVIVVCNFLVTTEKADWYWRTGGFGLVTLGSVGISWFVLHHKHKLVYGFLALLLLPGAYNFYTEQYFRFNSCTTPGAYLARVNSEVDLHTAIASSSYGAQDSYIAGRLPIQPDHPAGKFLWVHSLPKKALKTWFNYDGVVDVCGQTAYGTSSPNGQYVHILKHEPKLVTESGKCQ